MAQNGRKPSRGEAGGEGDRVLLGDADVEAALGEGLGEQVEPGAGRHGGVDRHDPLVGGRLADQLLGEHRGVAGRVRLGLVLRAGDHVELGDTMILVGGTLGRPVALALLGDDVDQHRPTVAGVADVLEHRDQVVEVVAVERADIVEAQLLEQRPAGGQAAGKLLRALGDGLQALGEVFAQLLGDVAKAAIGVRGDDLGQIGAHRPGRRRDRHVVVVEDHDQPGTHGTRVVHGLVGHAGAHGTVADHGDHVALDAVQLGRDGHAEASRDRGRAVCGTERVVVAFRATGEAGDPAGLAQGADARAAAGQDLVRVGLVADVPDQPVVRRVEDMVQGHGELDHTKTSAEMPAGHGDRIDRLLPQLGRQLHQAATAKAAQVAGLVNLVEERGRGHGEGDSLAERFKIFD